MAPVQKRRRVEDEVRKPKKKIRVKKQTEYHSSSEDDENVDTAPEPKFKSDANATVLAPKKQPKPILKQSAPVQQTRPTASDDEIFDSEDELEQNTAQNAVLAEQETSDDEAGALENDEPDLAAASSLSDDNASDSDTSLTSSQTSSTTSAAAARRKRNDPAAFATSISRILDTKLSTSKRSDPVLSRSRSAAQANRELADNKLSQQARAQMRSEKREKLDKGRVRDVLGLESEAIETGKVLEEEARLKKTAQRGVVRLFNAVRAAQVAGEEGRRKAREEGVVGLGKREERVGEMSKQGFLELISRGG